MEEIIDDLIYYVRTDEIEEIQKILENEDIKTINNIKDENNNSLLHFACANNNVDMIRFLLYECTIDYNLFNNSGNSPLLWAIQNKNLEAIKEVLFFDYYLHKMEYIAIEKKPNELYENIFKELITPTFLKTNYKLSNQIKNKINALNILDYFTFLHTNDKLEDYSFPNKHELDLYKERNKIYLLKNNEFSKNILSESFNIQNENILHLILNHPISSILDNQESVENNPNFKLNNNVDQDNNNEVKENDFTTNISEAKIVQEQVHELIINESVKIDKQNVIIKIREIGLNYYGKCIDDNNLENDLTGINIWECSIIASKWLADICIQDNSIFSNKNILEIGSGCALNSLSLFIHSNIVGRTNSSVGPANLVISDINEFTLDNILYNTQINNELLNYCDPNWENKIKICNMDWTNDNTYLKDVDNQTYLKYDCIIGSDLIYDKNIVPSILFLLNNLLKKNGIFFYVCKQNRDGVELFFDQLKQNFIVEFFKPPENYFINTFINMDQELFDTKFSEFGSSNQIVMIKCVPSQ
ncbi:methyltransferase, putative [Plasmodium chabaudi chabaudi]|uniref:Methyltransferase, putative n=1 Tax=Plasmodium chabaudi chabaudi TaxID=31271 RepID=A0A1D3LD60_PLACU|nr:methyltransferase, putative [Plasmodium chabaudi chabaudi]